MECSIFLSTKSKNTTKLEILSIYATSVQLNTISVSIDLGRNPAIRGKLILFVFCLNGVLSVKLDSSHPVRGCSCCNLNWGVLLFCCIGQ